MSGINWVGNIESEEDLKEPGDAGKLPSGDTIILNDDMTSALVKPVGLSADGLLTSSSITLASTGPVSLNVETDWEIFTRLLAHDQPAQKIISKTYWESIEDDFINAVQSLGLEHSIELIAPQRSFYNPSSGTEIFMDAHTSVYLKKNDQIVLQITVVPENRQEIKEQPELDFKDQLKDL
jgi:hypothetical protein